MSSEVKHYGVRGMRWDNKKTGTLEPNQRMGGIQPTPMGRMEGRPTGALQVTPQQRQVNRERMSKVADWLKSKPPIMQKKVSNITNMFQDAAQRKHYKEFLKSQGIDA